MRLHKNSREISALSTCPATLSHCPFCGDLLVAPETTEFVDSSEIRHHWLCEACGQLSETSVELISQVLSEPRNSSGVTVFAS